MAKFEQLASDALVTPERVLPGQPQHQLLALGRQLRSSGTAEAAKACPAATDQGPVPARDGRWLHQEQGPGRELAAEGSQDQAVRRPPARASSGASEDEQLLAEDEKFEIAIGGGAAAKDEEVDQHPEERIEESQQHGQAE